MAFIAKRTLKWGKGRITAGDPVPEGEPGRNYRALLRLGHIEEVAGGAPAPSAPPPPSDELLKIATPKQADALREGGFDTVEKVANAAVEDLTALPGIGDATAETLIDKAIDEEG